MSRPSLIALLLLALSYGASLRAQSPEPPTAVAAAGAPISVSGPTDSSPAADGKTPPAAKTTAPPAAGAAEGSKAAAGSARGAKGNDRLELSTTEISGNRELPKVLYVVPWRRPDIGDAVGRPPNSLVEEALTPVDREVFRRQNRYYATLEAGAAPAKSQPAAAGGVPPHAAPKD